MANGKVKSSSAPAFVKAGGKAMFGKQSAGPAKAATTAAGAGSGGGKFGKGGGKAMFGKQSAGPKAPGKVGK